VTLLPAALLVTAALVPTPAATPGIPGTWVYHQTWEQAPAGAGSGSHAVAVVLRFCPSGAFLLVKGVLSRRGNSISFSSGEGRQIWSGRWEKDGVRLKTTYRLKSYEARFPGAEEATRRDVHAQAIPAADHLRFVVPQTGPRTFEPASALPGGLEERFLECRDEPAPTPSPR
jgi:hypothetical protein